MPTVSKHNVPDKLASKQNCHWQLACMLVITKKRQRIQKLSAFIDINAMIWLS